MNQIVGALWKRIDKKGSPYFSGVIRDLHGDVNLAVFPNERKEGNQPDFNIVISFGYEKKKVEGTVEKTEDDIPF